jgi:cytochrome c oxidase cbb3-type subunit 3
MISWQTSLTPKQMQQVGSYVLSLQGTTPANGKAPEGPVWTEVDKPAGQDSLKITDSSKVKIDSTKVKIDTSKVKKDTLKAK